MTDPVTAAFFVPRSEATVAELAAQAGVRDARGDEVLDGTWAGMRARVGRSRLELHDLVWIQLSQREWLAPRALDAPAELALADDPNLPQAEAFRDACLALGAEVAVFVTHAAQADLDRIAGDHYRHVLGLDAEALARAFVGLLYLDDRVREGYARPPDRDTLATDRGLALFAGRGRARWH